MDPCPGDPDIEEPPLFVHGIRCISEGDGHQTLAEPYQEHSVPLESFRGVQRRQRDTLKSWRVLCRGSFLQLRNEVLQREATGRTRTMQLVGQGHQRGEGFPALPDRARALRCFPAVAQRSQNVPHQLGNGVVVRCPRARTQLQERVPHLSSGEKPLPAAELVPNPGTGESLFIGFGLAIGSVQDGNLAGWNTAFHQHADSAGDVGGLSLIIAAFGESGLRTGRTLGNEFERR